MASPIEEVIKAAKAARSSANVNHILEDIDLDPIYDELRTSINKNLNNIIDKNFPQLLKNNIQTILPAILEAVFTAQNESLNDINDINKKDNLTAVDNALQQALEALEQLDNTNVFTQDLDFDPERLNIISTANVSAQDVVIDNTDDAGININGLMDVENDINITNTGSNGTFFNSNAKLNAGNVSEPDTIQ